ncbi:MAG: ABC transporter permease [Wenzhouxiangella sp.]|jgi:ABC-2 type transport system permease protein|nr:ABC transporter permease [Wenzhouxiangella sp.]
MSVRVSAASYWIGYKTILIKEITRILRIWAQTLIPPVITMSLYFVIFGAIIGRRVGEMGGIPYMEFIVPGLIMLSVITNAYGNITSSFFGAKFGRHVEELLVSPLPPWIILAGYVSGAVFRAMAVGLLVWLIAGLFSGFHLYDPLVSISILLLTAIVFSLAGFINAIYAQKFDDISIIPTFVLQPLTYLGGVFFSTSLLPGVWEKISLVNPIVYMVSAFRYGLLGISDIPLWIAYALVLAFGGVLFAICMVLLTRGVGLRT